MKKNLSLIYILNLIVVSFAGISCRFYREPVKDFLEDGKRIVIEENDENSGPRFDISNCNIVRINKNDEVFTEEDVVLSKKNKIKYIEATLNRDDYNDDTCLEIRSVKLFGEKPCLRIIFYDISGETENVIKEPELILFSKTGQQINYSKIKKYDAVKIVYVMFENVEAGSTEIPEEPAATLNIIIRFKSDIGFKIGGEVQILREENTAVKTIYFSEASGLIVKEITDILPIINPSKRKLTVEINTNETIAHNSIFDLDSIRYLNTISTFTVSEPENDELEVMLKYGVISLVKNMGNNVKLCLDLMYLDEKYKTEYIKNSSSPVKLMLIFSIDGSTEI